MFQSLLRIKNQSWNSCEYICNKPQRKRKENWKTNRKSEYIQWVIRNSSLHQSQVAQPAQAVIANLYQGNEKESPEKNNKQPCWTSYSQTETKCEDAELYTYVYKHRPLQRYWRRLPSCKITPETTFPGSVDPTMAKYVKNVAKIATYCPKHWSKMSDN